MLTFGVPACSRNGDRRLGVLPGRVRSCGGGQQQRQRRLVALATPHTHTHIQIHAYTYIQVKLASAAHTPFINMHAQWRAAAAHASHGSGTYTHTHTNIHAHLVPVRVRDVVVTTRRTIKRRHYVGNDTKRKVHKSESAKIHVSHVEIEKQPSIYMINPLFIHFNNITYS